MFSEFSVQLSSELPWRGISPIQNEPLLTLSDLQTNQLERTKDKLQVSDQLYLLRERINHLQTFMSENLQESFTAQLVQTNPNYSVNSFQLPDQSMILTSQFGKKQSDNDEILKEGPQEDQKVHQIFCQNKNLKKNSKPSNKESSPQVSFLQKAMKNQSILNTKKKSFQSRKNLQDSDTLDTSLSRTILKESSLFHIENNRAFLSNQIKFYQSQNKSMVTTIRALKRRIGSYEKIRQERRDSCDSINQCLDQSQDIRTQQKCLISQLRSKLTNLK